MEERKLPVMVMVLMPTCPYCSKSDDPKVLHNSAGSLLCVFCGRVWGDGDTEKV